MALEAFKNLAKIFNNEKLGDDQENELFKETLIMTLSRMTRADMSIEAVEVGAVIKFVQDATGVSISDSTVRVAASSEMFESAPLDKHLQKVAKHISSAHRRTIVQGLAEVINSDGKVSNLEAELFNKLVNALQLEPSELLGLGS